MSPSVPVSWGEVIDKITILQIKVERLESQSARANATKELGLLSGIAGPVLARGDIAPMVARLKTVNQALWEIEDDIRDCERAGDFGLRFVELARAVYHTNDRRAALKREVNVALGSALVEEKSYAAY